MNHKMPELAGCQIMGISNLYGISFDAGVALSLDNELILKSCSTDCDKNTSGFLTELSFCEYFVSNFLFHLCHAVIK